MQGLLNTFSDSKLSLYCRIEFTDDTWNNETKVEVTVNGVYLNNNSIFIKQVNGSYMQVVSLHQMLGYCYVYILNGNIKVI